LSFKYNHTAKIMKKYYAEAIGTFAMVFCGTGGMTINEGTF